MKEDCKKKKAYISPKIQVIKLSHAEQILAGSPPVNTLPDVTPIGDGGTEELGGEEEG